LTRDCAKVPASSSRLTSLGLGVVPRQAERRRAEADTRVSKLPAWARKREAIERDMTWLIA